MTLPNHTYIYSETRNPLFGIRDKEKRKKHIGNV